MSFNGSVPVIETRGRVPDFVLYEVASPNGWSRGEVPALAGTKIGDLVKADGTVIPVTGIDATIAADIAGISMTTVPAYFGGLTREGDIKVATIKRDAEIKDTIFAVATSTERGVIVTALAALGIDVIACSPDAKF